MDYKNLVFKEFPYIQEARCTELLMNEYKELKGKSKPKLVVFIKDWYRKLYVKLVVSTSTGKARPVDAASTFGVEASDYTPTFTYKAKKTCVHDGMTPVEVGGTKCLYLTGTRHLHANSPLPEVDYIVALESRLLPNTVGKWKHVFNVDMRDMGGICDLSMGTVPMVADLLKKGNKVLMYCIGSHGRTGSMLAMLIAHMEPEVEDPVAAARERHCIESVETYQQIRGIFEFAGKPIPSIYDEPANVNVNYQPRWQQGHFSY